MTKIYSETLLRDYLLLQKCSTELENLALPNRLQLTPFVPLPFPAPRSAPDHDMVIIHKNPEGSRSLLTKVPL